RPALTRLRRLCREGAVDAVVVYKLDRLSRSVVDTVKLVLEEWEGRVCLKSTREAVDTATPMGRQIFYLLVSYAEWERSVIRERTSAGKWRRAREGRNPGAVAPYGYRNAPGGRFLLEHAEAPVVRRIFAEALGERSARQIAARLNADGVPSRKGSGWSAPVIAKILRNPCYMGVLAYGRSIRGPGGRRTRRAEPACTAGVFPLLVEPELFVRVQAGRTARRPEGLAPRAAASEPLLTGLAVCGLCGGALTGHRRHGERYRYYRCGEAIAKGSAVCAAGYLPRDAVDAAVATAIAEVLGAKATLPDQRTRAAEAVRLEIGRIKSTVRSEARRRRLAQARAARLRTAFLKGDVGGRELQGILAVTDQEQRQAEGELARLQAELTVHERLLLELPSATNAQAPTLGEAWAALSPAERKAVLRTFVARAELAADMTSGAISLSLTWYAK
ncbi:MAG TPA: recombinase family protein, partial [Symbiobacteriaceae bacterium]|nr:recombinase family protein [Symbiobacteriaceae bacterium]